MRRHNQAEINAKISATLKGKHNGGGISKDNPNYVEICRSVQTGVQKYWDSRPFDSLGKGSRRTRVIKEQAGKCLLCHLDSWLEQPLNLQLDHIDGDTKNNRRENLRALCPNCHSQTSTFGFTGRQHTEETKKKSGHLGNDFSKQYRVSYAPVS